MNRWWFRGMTLLLAVGIVLGLARCGRDRAQQPPATASIPSVREATSEGTASIPTVTVKTTPTRAPRSAVEVSQEGLQPLSPTGELDGIPVGFTRDGHAYRGNPEAAVVMVEYSEFQCPFCGRHERTTAPQLKEAYLRTGKILQIFRDFPLESIHAQARKAAEAARCAGEQGAEQFWAMHDLLFERAGQWADQKDAIDRFKLYAQELELDHATFNECLTSGRTSPAIDADLEAGLTQGVQGTPTFFLNGYPIVGAQPFSVFQSVIDALLAGNPPPTPQPSAQIPYWATAEGMSPDPERSGYTRAGDAFIGSPDAQVIILEFSDFQCPYCRRHVLETEPQIKKEYIETGLVRVIYKHFPVPGHQHAPLAGIVAECAGQQGKFWRMHDRLFATQPEWSGAQDVRPIFDRLAQEIELDLTAYQACLDDPQVAEKVQRDFDEGRRVGVRGTPNFIVLKGQSGQFIPGAIPYEQFKQILDAALAAE